MMLLRRFLFVALAVGSVVTLGAPAGASDVGIQSAMDYTPVARRMTFPVQGPVSYSNDFGACRDGCARAHQGNDLMGSKLQVDVAANDGIIAWARLDAGGTAGNMVVLRDAEGWEYWYLHLNNDTPGTDDGLNPSEWILVPGVKVGMRVKAGQPIAFMGDSGNAETTAPHTHFELHRPDGTAVNPWHSLRLAQGLRADPWCTYPTNPTPRPSAKGGRGYWLLGADGAVYPRGGATFFGAANARPHTGTAVALTPTPSGAGYWIATSSGQVLAFGDAGHRGDLAGRRLNAPVRGMSAAPDGRGYWLFAGDGGVFSFGSAAFYGSTGAMRLNAPVVGMAVTKPGRGYWLFAQDGGVFSFGDAAFYGSTGALRLNAPVIGMVRSAGGAGYLLLGADGGAFAFGDARFYGSIPGFGLCTPAGAVALSPTRTGRGYWIVDTAGNVVAFGDAPLYGDEARNGIRPVAMAVVPV
jgi:hypothetical protein